METIVLIFLLGIASYFGFEYETEPIDTGDPTELVEPAEVTVTGDTKVVSVDVVKHVEVGWGAHIAGAVFRDWKCVPESKSYDPTSNCFNLEEVGWQPKVRSQ